MPRSYVQLILVIALMLGVSYYLAPGSDESLVTDAWENKLPKTYLVNTRSWNYSELGALTDVLEADKATFYLSGRESLLESPRLYSHNLRDETWSVSAKVGRYENRRKILTLTDTVILTNDTKQVQLATEEMKINLQRNTARSTVPVTLTHGRNSTRADSMFANFDAQTVRLKPNVESIYFPPDSSTGAER